MRKSFVLLVAVIFGFGLQNANGQGVTINGVTWATKNVGASSPEGYGNYYTWEQAQTACPKGWRLPTYDEFKMFEKQIPSVWTWTAKGITGRELGENNNTIFLPAAGNYQNGVLLSVGKEGRYWCSKEYIADSFAYFLSVSEGRAGLYNNVKSQRCSVRCVAK